MGLCVGLKLKLCGFFMPGLGDAYYCNNIELLHTVGCIAGRTFVQFLAGYVEKRVSVQ